MIKELKKDNLIYTNFEEKTTDENGNEIWNIPTDLEKFKTMAIDTINWQIGDRAKKYLGNTQTNLSASNAKGIVLVAKVLNSLNPDLTNLTELERDSWNKMQNLANTGYADSKLLNQSLGVVTSYIQKGANKIANIQNAGTLEEVIDILNEDF